jgi:CBS domain-containing protein
VTEMVVTRPLVSMRASASVVEAADLMCNFSIGALGVLDRDKKFVGIITERDVLWLVAQKRATEDTLLQDVVNDFPVVVEGPITPSDALDQMRRSRIRHLIVKEGDDYRMVSIRDVAFREISAEETKGTALPDDHLRVRDIMVTPPIVCRATDQFERVVDILADQRITGMPVVDNAGELVGVVSERDLAYVLGGALVRLALRRKGSGESLPAAVDLPRDQRRVQDIMSTPPIVIAPTASTTDAARLMATERINRLPVVQDSNLIGVITRTDVLASAGRVLASKS